MDIEQLMMLKSNSNSKSMKMNLIIMINIIKLKKKKKKSIPPILNLRKRVKMLRRRRSEKFWIKLIIWILKLRASMKELKN